MTPARTGARPAMAALLLLCAMTLCQVSAAVDMSLDSVITAARRVLPDGYVAADMPVSQGGTADVELAAAFRAQVAAATVHTDAADAGDAQASAGNETVHRPSTRSMLHTSNPPAYVAGATFHVKATGKCVRNPLWRTNGTTASQYGLSLGNANAGSNWLAFMARMGINYGRLFVNTNTDLRSSLGGNFGRALDGTAVSSLGAWNTAVSQLRSSAGQDLNHGWKVPLLYPKYVGILGSPINGREYQGAVSTIIDQLQARGVSMLVVMSLTCKTATRFQLKTSTKSAAYWQERWELYKYVYQFGRYMAGKGVGSIEIYNEPNLDNSGGCLTNQLWLDNLRIRSQALRAAYSDFGNKPLQVVGPPFSNPNYAGTFGQVAVQNNELVFPSNAKSASHKNLDRYSYHVYGGIGYFYSVIYMKLAQQVRHDYKMSVDISEYGITDRSVPGSKGCIADQAPLMSRLSSTTAYLLGANVPRLNIFKASNTPSGSGATINGLHWADNDVAPYNYGDVTLMGEAAGLIMRKTAGGHTLYQVTTPYQRRAPTTAFGVADAHSYYLYVVNDEGSTKPLLVDVSGWGTTKSGATVLANQVSTGKMTLVTAQPKLSSTKTFRFSQPGYSVVQFVIPKGKPAGLSIVPSDDAYVSAGANQGRNYGTSSSLYTALSSSASQSSTSATFLRFPVTKVAAGHVQAATLKLYVRKAASATSTLMVLGVGSGWSEKSITWNNAPSLKTLNTGTTVNRIARNYVDWLSSPQPVIVGHIVVPGGTAGKSFTIDVSDYVNNVLGGRTDSRTHAAFAVVRLYRRNSEGGGTYGYSGDSLGSNNVIFVSKEGGQSGPRLTVYHT